MNFIIYLMAKLFIYVKFIIQFSQLNKVYINQNLKIKRIQNHAYHNQCFFPFYFYIFKTHCLHALCLYSSVNKQYSLFAFIDLAFKKMNLILIYILTPINLIHDVIILDLIIKAKMITQIIQATENLLPNKKYNINPSGSFMMSTIPYYILAFITIAGFFALDSHAFIFIAIIYSILPLLDEFLSMDWKNPTKQERLALEENNFWFKFVLYFTAIVDWVLFFKMMGVFVNYQFTPSSILNLMGIVFIFSNLESVQFAISHEIFHKQNFFDRFFGTIHMSKLLYMHFTYEHLWGHHKKVATPEDPASAEKGINVYKFIVRSFLGSYKSVYNMQKEANKPIYMNCAVLSVVSAIIFSGLIWRVYGTQAFVLYMITAFGAIAYLEAINYIEHYGLRREKKENGEYEKVTIKHSWNSPHRISNYLLFKLQRHSDHHENSLKPYQTLDSLEDSPMLSHGYSLTIIMALFPSVWFAVMDPLVDEYNKLKTGTIDSEVRAKANKLIRMFIIEISLASLVLCIANFLILDLGADYQSAQTSL